MYLLLILFLFYRIYFVRRSWKADKASVINNLFKGLTLFFVLFTICWGFNYYRTPLYERLAIENTYSTEELVLVTHKLVNQVNALHSQYAENDSAIINVSLPDHIIIEQAANGYQELALAVPEFTYKNTSIKSSLFSLPLTYMGFGGYINPFTNEAQVNNRMPKTSLFVTASHEIAHQVGIGPEAEANFVGYWAATKNTNAYFDYAAASFALRYCLSRYPFKNEADFKAFLKNINPGVLQDWQRNKEFWEAHESFIDTFFKFIYDKFLKVNQQEFGITGYSKFLDLLIQHELNKKGCE
ncbi:DUF3810 domain-containing protein [Flavobacterium agricola]|uniref:DUF3810 domain-containing protein n=1 Tax=Flavobacterium agricola TaxID=2870839 RepID=A0ABY6M203_9FLAO|nr:DUF3810 domain-containing protein [Flavobacterium agricola]